MRISRDFIFEKDDDTGLLGLRPLWMANSNATDGIAHDVLEHPSNAKLDPTESELLALGALVALRMQTGVIYSQYYSPSENLASMLATVLTEAAENSLPLPSPRKSRPLVDNDWSEEVMKAAIPKAFEQARAELVSSGDLDDDDQLEQFSILGPPDLPHTILALLRQGFRQAVDRYAKVDMYTLGSTTFEWLNKTSEKLCNAEYLAPGTHLRLNIDLAFRNITIKLKGEPARDLDYMI